MLWFQLLAGLTLFSLRTSIVEAFSSSGYDSSLESISALQHKSDNGRVPLTPIHLSRRDALWKTVAFVSLACSQSMMNPEAARAKSAVKPEAAFANLLAARQELGFAAKTYFAKQDSDGLREFLDEKAVNMNNFEANAQALLESKLLDSESKKAIGTIRRYGVGADVSIMYGALKAEVNEEHPKFQELTKFFLRTLDSLEEVILICRDNGL